MRQPKIHNPHGFTLTAVRLRNCWAIRPEGAIGTCGWIDGKPWTVQYVKSKPYSVREEK